MLVRNADDLLFSISRSLHRPALSLGRILAPSGGNSQRQITAKVRALGKAALGRYPLVGDRLGRAGHHQFASSRSNSASALTDAQARRSVKGIRFPRRWYGGMISANLEVIWEMSAQTKQPPANPGRFIHLR